MLITVHFVLLLKERCKVTVELKQTVQTRSGF